MATFHNHLEKVKKLDNRPSRAGSGTPLTEEEHLESTEDLC